MLRFVSESIFVHCRVDGDNRIKVIQSPMHDIDDWGQSTRVSPVYGYTWLDRGVSSLESDFAGASTIVICGCVDPIAVLEKVKVPDDGWLTLGLSNFVAQYANASDAAELIEYCIDNRIPCESWLVEDGVILEERIEVDSAEDATFDCMGQGIAECGRKIEAEHHLEVFREGAAALKVASAQSKLLEDPYRSNLRAYLAEMVRSFPEWASIERENRAQFLGEAQNVNSGLSRYISQMLMCSPPIPEGECHFWTHSLFGLGIPMMGLHRMLNYIDCEVRGQHLRERAEAFDKRKYASGKTRQKAHGTVMDSVEDFVESTEATLPTLGYFSARDGFRRTTYSVSVPAACVACCNSKLWSLRSTTHEISHGIIADLLTVILPVYEPDAWASVVQGAIDNSMNPYEADNALDEVRALIIGAAWSIDGDEETAVLFKHGLFRGDLAQKMLNVPFNFVDVNSAVKKNWREINEIMAHVFDFLVFYRHDEKTYIESIWNSWCVIPGIKIRTREYLRRTVLAIQSNYLFEAASLGKAKRIVKECLGELASRESALEGVKYAHEMIEELCPGDNAKMTDSAYLFNRELESRGALVAAVRQYLYPSKAAERIGLQEPAPRGDSLGCEPYVIEKMRVHNPVGFVMGMELDERPDSVKSAWLYYYLRFRTLDDSVS